MPAPGLTGLAVSGATGAGAKTTPGSAACSPRTTLRGCSAARRGKQAETVLTTLSRKADLLRACGVDVTNGQRCRTAVARGGPEGHGDDAACSPCHACATSICLAEIAGIDARNSDSVHRQGCATGITHGYGLGRACSADILFAEAQRACRQRYGGSGTSETNR